MTARDVRSWVAVASLAFLISSCSDTDEVQGAAADLAAPDPAFQGEMRLAVHSGRPIEVAEELAAAFNEVYPDIDVEVRSYPIDQYYSAVRTEIAAGNPPDVMLVNMGWGHAGAIKVLAKAGVMEDLSSSPDISVPDELRDVVEHEGGLYAVASAVSVIAPIYNVDVFEEYDIDLPRTFSDVLDMCHKLAEADVVPFALAGASPAAAMMPAYPLSASTAYSHDPDLAERLLDGETTFAESGGWELALEAFSEMRDNRCFAEDAIGTPFESMLDQVATGRAAMVIYPDLGMEQLRLQNPDGNFAILPLPATDEPEDVRLSYGALGGFGVPKNVDNKESALAFMAFLSSPEGREAFPRIYGQLPAGLDPSELPEAYSALSDLWAPEKFVTFLEQEWPSTEVRSALESGMQSLLMNDAAPAEVLDSMDAAWE